MDPEMLRRLEREFRHRCRVEGGASGVGGSGLALWEWRATLAGQGSVVEAGSLRADGGWRREVASSQAGTAARWEFTVGEDLAESGHRVEEAVRALAAEAAKVSERLAFRVWGRLRCWWSPDSGAASSWEQGLLFTLDGGGRRRDWLVEDVRQAPDADILAQAVEDMDAAPPVTGSPVPSGWSEGPVVLEPEAAGWWVHEMAHAAMESAAIRAPNAAGLRIVDDPGAAPWPAGFRVDDRGCPARRAVLWDAHGSASSVEPGRWRSASVRQSPQPLLSCTRLEWDPSVPRMDPPADGALWIRAIDAGRFDPLSGEILLAGKTSTGEDVLLMCTPEQAWRRARVCRGGTRDSQQMAACSRQGLTLPVMVGAPTLVLEPLRRYLRNRA
ncbi:MAG: hypothetical protein Q9Q40_12510 [Acidobacteriota bacterium]|nr:hypothetical protein [Acidobacteriota bacterium]